MAVPPCGPMPHPRNHPSSVGTSPVAAQGGARIGDKRVPMASVSRRGGFSLAARRWRDLAGLGNRLPNRPNAEFAAGLFGMVVSSVVSRLYDRWPEAGRAFVLVAWTLLFMATG